MSKLITGTEVMINGISDPVSRTVGILGSRVIGITSENQIVNGTSTLVCMVKMMVGDGSAPTYVGLSDAVATINTALNLATTTNSITEVPLTRKNDDGTTTTTYEPIQNIVRIYPYPGDTAASGDSLVLLENATKTIVRTIRTDETVNAIKALVNA